MADQTVYEFGIFSQLKSIHFPAGDVLFCFMANLAGAATGLSCQLTQNTFGYPHAYSIFNQTTPGIAVGKQGVKPPAAWGGKGFYQLVSDLVQVQLNFIVIPSGVISGGSQQGNSGGTQSFDGNFAQSADNSAGYCTIGLFLFKNSITKVQQKIITPSEAPNYGNGESTVVTYQGADSQGNPKSQTLTISWDQNAADGSLAVVQGDTSAISKKSNDILQLTIGGEPVANVLFTGSFDGSSVTVS